ncbi:MAG: T9SS type A sorting domain-containing protein [Bacteroidota bacterium]|nr:T9SS type A sorting domain-containing protein [Bacteroidota bacterium]
MKNALILLSVLLFSTFSLKLHAQDGMLDSTFNALGYGANGDIHTVSIQIDGKMIIGGGFTTYNGYTRNRITRLNTDGTLDTSFHVGTGAAGIVSTSAIQSDGKIIIGGYFNTFNGFARKRIARLNTDGSVDVTFNPGTGANGFIGTCALQSDGKIIIGGGFDNYNGIDENYIARLNTDGSLDTTFNSGTAAEYRVFTTSVQNDDKIIIGGWFLSYNGVTKNYIARLNADGSLDTSFNTGTGFDYIVYTSTIQSDGKIVIGGDFSSFNSVSRNNIARLNTDGSLDTTFNPGIGTDNIVLACKEQNDGKILIAGSFNDYNGTAIHNHIARINMDGSIDSSFYFGTGLNYGEVNSVTIQSDEKIIVGCSFDYYHDAVELIGSIARLENGNNATLLKSITDNDLKVYPNPMSETLTIEPKGNNEKLDFEIINGIGQTVLKGKLTNKTTIETNHLDAGFYFLKIGNGKVVKFKKLVKE